MEQQIKAFTQTKEVIVVNKFRHILIAFLRIAYDVLSTTTDILGRGRISLLCDEFTALNNVSARHLAVQANLHKPARSKDVEQNAPSR